MLYQAANHMCLRRHSCPCNNLQVELRGFRNNLRLAAQASSEGDEEEEEGEEVEAPARRTKRALGGGWVGTVVGCLGQRKCGWAPTRAVGTMGMAHM